VPHPFIHFFSLATKPTYTQSSVPFVGTHVIVSNDDSTNHAEFSLDGGTTVHGQVLAGETLELDDLRFATVDVRDYASGSAATVRCWVTSKTAQQL